MLFSFSIHLGTCPVYLLTWWRRWCIYIQKKYYHEVQEKVLEYIIKNHPDKIREVEYQSPVVISKNKLYPKEGGSRLLSNGYYMATQSPWPE
jgi:hypothetical protein